MYLKWKMVSPQIGSSPGGTSGFASKAKRFGMRPQLVPCPMFLGFWNNMTLSEGEPKTAPVWVVTLELPLLAPCFAASIPVVGWLPILVVEMHPMIDWGPLFLVVDWFTNSWCEMSWDRRGSSQLEKVDTNQAVILAEPSCPCLLFLEL